MGKTGDSCTESGVYKCSSGCGVTISLSKGETFPPCKICGNVYWNLLWKS